MPKYLLRFKVETCLARKEDLVVDFGSRRSLFLFSQKSAADKYVIVQLESESKNNREAWDEAATSVLPPILDAISFSTGTPLLLRDCELVLKDESGQPARRALYVGHRHVPSEVQFGAVEIQEMNQILNAGNDLRLPICWHRYALDRELALERFVFHWLAFEALAGDTDVATRCPKCYQELHHCDNPISHRGSSKVTAREIFRAAHAETSEQEFNNRIWSKARNYVFHGRRYPEPAYLVEINSLSEMLHAAADKHVAKALGLGERDRPHRGYETWYRVFLFVEWQTNDPKERFARDWPATHLATMAAEDTPGKAYHNSAQAGIELLDYQSQSANW